MLNDLVAAKRALELARDDLSAAQMLDSSFQAAQTAPHTYVRMFEREARAEAEEADRHFAMTGEQKPLAGLAVSVKDLFAVRNHPTTAGSRVLENAQPAQVDSACVARLRAAGAALVGHTNMTEFAYSGLGLNPHFGTPINPVASRSGERRIPGGSSSGAAVSVASGSAWAAMGTDTGGSLRIPAALCGLVGFKSTQEQVSRDGILPLSSSLDTAGAITRSVRDAALIHSVLSATRFAVSKRPAEDLKVVVPCGEFLDGMDATVAGAFERSLMSLRAAGVRVIEAELPGLRQFDLVRELASIVAVEAYQWHQELLERNGRLYDPRVSVRIQRGAAVPRERYKDLLGLRSDFCRATESALSDFDVALVPTVPVVAPLLKPLETDEALYTAANLLMLRNPSVVNHMDGCAISIPCHQADDELPVGLMLFNTRGQDSKLLSTALAIESLLRW